MDHPMPPGQGNITLPTIDHGYVTFTEPPWCAGHGAHDPRTAREDLVHVGPVHQLIVDDWRLGVALIFHAPFSGYLPSAAVHLDFSSGQSGLMPPDLHAIAAAMERSADEVRALADQLATILAGGAK
jgi:hypothetical protein